MTGEDALEELIDLGMRRGKHTRERATQMAAILCKGEADLLIPAAENIIELKNILGDDW